MLGLLRCSTCSATSAESSEPSSPSNWRIRLTYGAIGVFLCALLYVLAAQPLSVKPSIDWPIFNSEVEGTLQQARVYMKNRQSWLTAPAFPAGSCHRIDHFDRVDIERVVHLHHAIVQLQRSRVTIALPTSPSALDVSSLRVPSSAVASAGMVTAADFAQTMKACAPTWFNCEPCTRLIQFDEGMQSRKPSSSTPVPQPVPYAPSSFQCAQFDSHSVLVLTNLWGAKSVYHGLFNAYFPMWIRLSEIAGCDNLFHSSQDSRPHCRIRVIGLDTNPLFQSSRSLYQLLDAAIFGVDPRASDTQMDEFGHWNYRSLENIHDVKSFPESLPAAKDPLHARLAQTLAQYPTSSGSAPSTYFETACFSHVLIGASPAFDVHGHEGKNEHLGPAMAARLQRFAFGLRRFVGFQRTQVHPHHLYASEAASTTSHAYLKNNIYSKPQAAKPQHMALISLRLASSSGRHFPLTEEQVEQWQQHLRSVNIAHSIADFGQLPMPAQLDLFRKTTVFVSREGADLTNAIFFPPLTAFVEYRIGALDSFWHVSVARLLQHVFVSVVVPESTTADVPAHVMAQSIRFAQRHQAAAYRQQRARWCLVVLTAEQVADPEAEWNCQKLEIGASRIVWLG